MAYQLLKTTLHWIIGLAAILGILALITLVLTFSLDLLGMIDPGRGMYKKQGGFFLICLLAVMVFSFISNALKKIYY
jgi:hypothetical protein